MSEASYVEAMRDHCDFLRDEAARLGFALYRFARMAEKIPKSVPDGTVVTNEVDGITITVADLRQAAEALKPVHQRIDL